MAKFPNQVQTLVVRFGDKYMSVKGNDVSWIDDIKNANKYGSKYAAKEHIRRLTNIPEGVEYISLN